MRQARLKHNTIFHYNDDEFVIETVSDAAPLLRQLDRERSTGQKNFHNFRKLGSLDPVMHQQWQKDFKEMFCLDPNQEPQAWLKFVETRLKSRDYCRLSLKI